MLQQSLWDSGLFVQLGRVAYSTHSPPHLMCERWKEIKAISLKWPQILATVVVLLGGGREWGETGSKETLKAAVWEACRAQHAAKNNRGNCCSIIPTTGTLKGRWSCSISALVRNIQLQEHYQSL